MSEQRAQRRSYLFLGVSDGQIQGNPMDIENWCGLGEAWQSPCRLECVHPFLRCYFSPYDHATMRYVR